MVSLFPATMIPADAWVGRVENSVIEEWIETIQLFVKIYQLTTVFLVTTKRECEKKSSEDENNIRLVHGGKSRLVSRVGFR